MLRVEERFVIRELYGKGVSISEIARLAGHDRKTIRAAVRQPLLPARRPARPRRAGKLAPYVPYLEIAGQGYAGKEMLVPPLCSLSAPRGGRRRPSAFETEPGEQAQVD